MPGYVRCPNCGGLNPAGSEWCGQCHQRFTASTPPPPPPPGTPAPAGPGAPGAPGPAPSTAPAADASPEASVEQQRGAFVVTTEGIRWTCSQCDTRNPLDASVCAVCGTTFAASVQPQKEKIERDPNTVAMYSLFFPGAGHWYMGLKGAAVARGVLSTWVVVVAVLAAVAGSVLMASVFGLTAFALWGLAAHDAYREASGQQRMVVLKSRVFVYVVLGLLLLMVVMLVSASLRAAS